MLLLDFPDRCVRAPGSICAVLYLLLLTLLGHALCFNDMQASPDEEKQSSEIISAGRKNRNVAGLHTHIVSYSLSFLRIERTECSMPLPIGCR